MFFYHLPSSDCMPRTLRSPTSHAPISALSEIDGGSNCKKWLACGCQICLKVGYNTGSRLAPPGCTHALRLQSTLSKCHLFKVLQCHKCYIFHTPLRNTLVFVNCYFITKIDTLLFVNLHCIIVICIKIHETYVNFHTMLLLLLFSHYGSCGTPHVSPSIHESKFRHNLPRFSLVFLTSLTIGIIRLRIILNSTASIPKCWKHVNTIFGDTSTSISTNISSVIASHRACRCSMLLDRLSQLSFRAIGGTNVCTRICAFWRWVRFESFLHSNRGSSWLRSVNHRYLPSSRMIKKLMKWKTFHSLKTHEAMATRIYIFRTTTKQR